MHIDKTKKINMNTYLVYLLLDGKNTTSAHGDIESLAKSTNLVWYCYPKFQYLAKWDNCRMKIDGQEYHIWREINGNLLLKESSFAFQAIKPYNDFFLERIDATYIQVYGSQKPPIMLPKYASNRLVIMEFCRQILYLRKNILKKKDSTFNFPILIGEYSCTR